MDIKNIEQPFSLLIGLDQNIFFFVTQHFYWNFLGDGELSFGYESSGRFVNKGEFKEYGKQYSEKDVIGAYIVSNFILLQK